MTTSINIGQPSLALPQSIVTDGWFPNISGNPQGFGSAAMLGFVITTAFDYEPDNVRQLMPADGQTLSIAAQNTLYALLTNTYGGNFPNTFKLPDLQGSAPVFMTSEGTITDWGKTQGSPDNTVQLSSPQLPASLGGEAAPIDVGQYGVGVRYLIQTAGLFPAGNSPTPNTIGMVFPYVAPMMGGVPDGFLPADGRTLNIADFETLYAVIGNTYGGNGQTTFALPDLRNRVPVGTGVTSTGQQIALGQEFGTSTTQLSPVQVASNEPLPTAQPSLGLHYVVATEGVYWGMDEQTPMLGQVGIYAGSRIPDNWTFAHGQLLPVNSSNGALYSLLRNNFGGDGTNTFALPDLQGRTIVGTGGVNNLQIGDTQGSFSEYITAANLPEIVTPVPGVQVLDENGQVAGDKITGKFELDVSGVWPQARVEYSSDGTTWSETYTAQEGSNTLYVRQLNVLGQASAATQAITFVLDTTAPEAPDVVIDGVAVAAPMAAPAFKAAVPADSNDTIPRTSTGKLSFGNVEDGATLQFSIDGGQTWSDTFEAQPGLNQVQVRQVDAAGNVSPASERIQFYWDGSDTDAAVTSTTTHSTGGNAITVEEHGALATGLGTEGIDLLIHGHQQDVTLPNDIEHIRLTENGLNNTVTGNAQDNVFEVIVGNWIIEGNGGQDTVRLANPMAEYVITQESHEGQLQATLYGPEGRIVVRDIETIEFSDAILIKTTGTDITEIDHLYEEVLGRNPDTEGLTYWVNQMNQGTSLADVTQALSQSTEFRQLYGTPSEEQLVQELYEAILNRAPDAEGLAYWTEALVVHGATEGELIASLLTSTESQDASTTQLSTGGLFVVG